MAQRAVGKNEKIWEWVEGFGIDYGRAREIKIDIDVDCNVAVYDVYLIKECYQHKLVARGENKTPEFLDWLKALGIPLCQHLQIRLDAGGPVKICADTFIEKELLEQLPDVLHVELVEEER